MITTFMCEKGTFDFFAEIYLVPQSQSLSRTLAFLLCVLELQHHLPEVRVNVF